MISYLVVIAFFRSDLSCIVLGAFHFSDTLHCTSIATTLSPDAIYFLHIHTNLVRKKPTNPIEHKQTEGSVAYHACMQSKDTNQ